MTAGNGMDVSTNELINHSSLGDDTALLARLNIIHNVLLCGSPGVI
jgi:hypothetical protein